MAIRENARQLPGVSAFQAIWETRAPWRKVARRSLIESVCRACARTRPPWAEFIHH